MKVHVKGGGDVQLGQADFVAEGGEGRVFARGSTGYKVYHDPTKAIPLGKIQALASIGDDVVIKPEQAIYLSGRKSEHVGHTFRFVRDTWTLCQLFTRSFREREGVTHDVALALLRRMQDAVHAVHKAGALIVDLNEMNVLVSRNFSAPFFIDVDSYQHGPYKATAIMPSVRDPLVQGNAFSEVSDWFSFAIVSFQLLVGIHPFKGTHPTIKGFEQRMAAGVSVFDAEVSMPKACYPLDVLPPAYRDWYRALFVHGERTPPPASLHQVVVIHQTAVRTIASTARLEIQELHDYGQPIRAVFGELVHAGDDVLLAGRTVWHGQAHGALVAVHTTKGRTVSAQALGGSLVLRDMGEGADMVVTLRADEVMAYGGALYARSGDRIVEVSLTETGTRVFAGVRVAANVLPNATRLYEGVALQSLLGEPHASLFPRAGACYQLALPELKGHRVLQAKLDSGVLMVLAAKGGQYSRFVFRFDDAFASYDLRIVHDVAQADLNFVVLDSGVCVCLTEDERLEVFSRAKGSSALKLIEDPALGGDMRLVKDGGRVRFFRGCKLYSLRMK